MKKYSKIIIPAICMCFLIQFLPIFAANNIDKRAAKIISGLPDILKSQYEKTTSTVTIPDFSKFSKPDKGWKWCHSESYQGNPWRVALTNELKRLVNVLKKEGVVSDFELSDSNGDTGLQISHIRSFIDKGCQVITSVPGSGTGLNAAIEAAYDKGIPFITIATSATSKKAINIDSNYWRWGYDMAYRISEKLNKKGNVLMVEGIAGNTITAQEREGAMTAFDKFPKVKVVRRVNGNWTPSVTKTVVLQTLATNPAPIHAVWTAGSEARVVAQAFKQAGRPLPIISGSITGDTLGYWKENEKKFKFTGHAVLPQWMAQALFRITTRIMMGQKPILNTLMIPIPVVEIDDFPKWYDSCLTPDSSSIFPAPGVEVVPASYLNAYFKSDKTAMGYDMRNNPKTCPK